MEWRRQKPPGDLWEQKNGMVVGVACGSSAWPDAAENAPAERAGHTAGVGHTPGCCLMPLWGGVHSEGSTVAQTTEVERCPSGQKCR